MRGFYMFEGAFWQGGGGWEYIEVSRSVSELDAAVADYVGTGSWDLYPFLTVKVPGLTAIRFTADGQDTGLPEAGGRYDGMDEGAIWEDLAADVYETELEAPQDIQAWVDWAGVALPELVPPVLPEGCGVVVDKRELRYGRNSTFDGCGL